MDDDELRLLEDLAKKQGGIPRRDSLQRSLTHGKRKHSCSGRVMITDESDLNKSMEEQREEEQRLEREAKKLKEWHSTTRRGRTEKDDTTQTRNQEQRTKDKESMDARIKELKRTEKEKKEKEEKERERKELEAWNKHEKEQKEKKERDAEEKRKEKSRQRRKQRKEAEERNNKKKVEETEKMIERILTAKENIIDATTRYSGSKIQFNKEDQLTVREEIDTLSSEMIKLVYKLGKQEGGEAQTDGGEDLNIIKKNLKTIENTLEEQREQNNKIMDEIKEIRQQEEKRRTTARPRATDTSRPQQQPTFAQALRGEETCEETQTEEEAEEVGMTLVTRRRRPKTYAQSASKEGTEGWKTPEPKEKLETRVTMTQEGDIKKLRDVVRAATQEEVKKTGGLKNIITTKSGHLILQYKDEGQRDAINKQLKLKADLTVKTNDKQPPKLTLTGVMRGYTDKELTDMLREENDDIRDNYEHDITHETRIISRRTCRNEQKENVTLQTTLPLFKHMVKKERLYLDMVTVYVEEAVSVALCYRCHKYGHVAKYCKDKETCHICGGAHTGTECRAREEDCPNCRGARIPIEERRHTARDRNCPCYRRKEQQARQDIDYGRGVTMTRTHNDA